MIEFGESHFLIGLTGTARAGKSRVASFLAEQFGFQHFRPSDIIRTALETEYGPGQFSRASYLAMSHKLRTDRGPGYYWDFIDLEQPRIIIDGIRHLDTARMVRAHQGFMIGIVATAEVRFQRAQYAQDSKPKHSSLDAFVKEELAELNSLAPHGAQILPVLWEIDPLNIIDTTRQTPSQVTEQVVQILLREMLVS